MSCTTCTDTGRSGPGSRLRYASATTVSTSTFIPTPTTGPTSADSDLSRLSLNDSRKGKQGESPQCLTHCWRVDPEELGRGTYGIVYKVKCERCHTEAARKDILPSPGGDTKSKQKRVQAMKDELDFLSHLDHPNIVRYLFHENQPNGLPCIYTEFCEYRDLERHISIRKGKIYDPNHLEFLFSEWGLWCILRQLTAALAKCHHGLDCVLTPEGLDEFTSFQSSWKSIVHRDIKPGNIFLKSPATVASHAKRGGFPVARSMMDDKEAIQIKLGDFGTACIIEEDVTKSTVAGTRPFWAPEIHRDWEEGNDRLTAWSVKSDIWSVGAIMHNFLVGKLPSNKNKAGTQLTWQERVQKLTQRTGSNNGASYKASDILVKVVAECLDDEPSKRPTALDVLALALKSDSSETGLRRSETFWRAVSQLPRETNGLAAATVRHFITEYLDAIDDVPFSATEACLILSLQSIFMRTNVEVSASLFHSRLNGDLKDASIYHAVAIATSQDENLRKLVWEETGWPKLPGLIKMSIRRDKDGRLPSNIAIRQMNSKVAQELGEIEDLARTQQMELKEEIMKETLQREMREATNNEVGFLFEILTKKNRQKIPVSVRVAESALVTAASYDYSSTTRELVKGGINPSAIVGRRRETALHFAARLGNEDLVRFLAENNANLRSRDYEGIVPLHCAAWVGNHGAVRTLLSFGADVNDQDDQGRTALYGAAGCGHLAVVRALLARGADRNIRGGSKRHTALDRAQLRGHTEVALELMQEEGTVMDTMTALVRRDKI